jgi:hypothetical protein
MDVQAPSAQTTLLILLGASAWPLSPEFHSSEAFANAARRVKAYFLNPRPFGLPAENLLDLFDSDKSTDELDVAIGQFLEHRIAALKKMSNPVRDLLLYFIGHGGFAGRDSDFYLAIRRTRTQSPRASSIDMISLAETLTESARHMRRIIILDCCFAAAAYSAFQAGPDQVALEKTVYAFKVNQKAVGFPTKGTTLLCSSSQKSPSLLLPDGSSTMFTKALVDTLVQGTTVQRDRLSLRDVKDGTADYLSEIRNAPRPVVLSPDQSEGDVADIPFFPNSWMEKQRLRRMEEERSLQEETRKAEEERVRQVEAERHRQAEEETRKAEEERQRKAEEERVRQVEAERHRQAEEERRKLQAEEEGRLRRVEMPVLPVETPSAQFSTPPGSQAAMMPLSSGSSSLPRLFQLSGWALIVGSVIGIVETFLNTFLSISATPYNSWWVLNAWIYAASNILFLLGLPGLYVKQSNKDRPMGIIGIVMIFAGEIGFIVYNFLVLLPATSYAQYDGLLNISNLLLIVGFLLLGIVIVRASIFPRWTGIVLIITSITEVLYFTPLSAMLNTTIFYIATISTNSLPFWIAIIGCGYTLLSRQKKVLAV